MRKFTTAVTIRSMSKVRVSEARVGSEDGALIVPLPRSDYPAAVKVVVSGGDAIVGRTLELLIRGVDYRVGFVPGPHLGEPGVLEGAELVVLAPGLTEEQRAAVFSAFKTDTRDVARVPLVELVPDLLQKTSVGARRYVPWPCRAEKLERQIRVALTPALGAQADEEG